MKNYIFAFLMMLVAVPACMWAKDNNKSTVVFTVSPKMTCQNCENKIKSNLRFEKGVSSIVTNLKEQTVTITYNPAKVSPERLTEAFKKSDMPPHNAPSNARMAIVPYPLPLRDIARQQHHPAHAAARQSPSPHVLPLHRRSRSSPSTNPSYNSI